MTLDMDHLMLRMTNGRDRRVFCKEIGIQWPPPERITIGDIEFSRIRMSELSDELMLKMPNVCRGAEYKQV